jgi:alanine racemase
MAFPQAQYGMVRVGVAQYGLNPFAPGPVPAAFAGLKPALRWTTRIAQVKPMPAGSAISYGATYRTTAGQRIAVIPVGYGDGFRRAPNFGHVLVAGLRCPIVGRVCMDNTMIDVSAAPGVQVDDEVVILGSQAGQTIAAEDIAARVGTINYDITTSLLSRAPRSYV